MTPVDPGSAAPAGPGGGRSDADLLADVRGRPSDAASTAAFGALYDRHSDSARALARQLARSPTDAEDLTSAAFARLLEVLRAGGGPTEAFRAYLLTSLRHLAYDRTRAERRLDLTEDIGDVVGVDPERTVVPFADPAVAGLERSLAARAFATLPERWQAVLWHLEVEGDSPADVAPLFGLTPNAVSALGYRAREGLRQAYLQEHLASDAGAPPRDRRHRETSERLGAYTRGGLSRRDGERVETHLAECDECRALAAELREVNSGMVRAAVGPTVLGAALVGYLATRGGTGDLFSVSSLPTTGELAVAGGGVLGVLSAVGGILRPDLLTRGAGRAVAAVGVVGLSAAGVTALALTGPWASGPDGAGAPGVPEALRAAPGLAPAAPLPPPAAPPVFGSPAAPGPAPAGTGGGGDGDGDGGTRDTAERRSTAADDARAPSSASTASTASGASGASTPSAGRHRGTGTGTGGTGRHRVTTTVVTTTTTVTHRADGRDVVRTVRSVERTTRTPSHTR